MIIKNIRSEFILMENQKGDGWYKQIGCGADENFCCRERVISSPYERSGWMQSWVYDRPPWLAPAGQDKRQAEERVIGQNLEHNFPQRYDHLRLRPQREIDEYAIVGILMMSTLSVYLLGSRSAGKRTHTCRPHSIGSFASQGVSVSCPSRRTGSQRAHWWSDPV